MTKLKAPLLSLGASGAIGESIVFFPWKGLNVAREYVIPANPNTTKQQVQRGYLAAAVALIHALQASAAWPLGLTDAMAYALLGSLEPTPRTWFNAICKQWLDQKVAGKIPAIGTGFTITPAVDGLTIKGYIAPEVGGHNDGDIFYGTSKSALINSITCTGAQLNAGRLVGGLTTGVKYYLQYRPDDPAALAGSNSGIYYGVPL